MSFCKTIRGPRLLHHFPLLILVAGMLFSESWMDNADDLRTLRVEFFQTFNLCGSSTSDLVKFPVQGIALITSFRMVVVGRP